MRFITAFLFLANAFSPLYRLSAAPNTSHSCVQEQLAELEVSSGGHLGIAAINTANNQRIDYRANERFPFCSTFKVMVVAAILKQSMTDPYLLEQKINYTQKEVDESGYAPITKNHLAAGMRISELSLAALCYSDNNAVNLLVKNLGGLRKVNAFAFSIGDAEFRLDRLEPELNSGIPEDNRDTTTPGAMATSLYNLTLGNVLEPAKCKKLLTWMTHNTTGDTRICAGVPQGWIVADKTGSGDYGITNDIGVLWPPNSAPIVVAIYFRTSNKQDAMHHDEIIAAATRIVVDGFTKK